MRQGQKKRPVINAVRREEIIKRIVEILRPEATFTPDEQKKANLRPINRSAVSAALDAKVRETVSQLENSLQYFSREAVRENREGARQIVSTIDTLKNQIRSAPWELHMRMKFVRGLDDADYFAWLNQLAISLKPAADNRDIRDKVKGHCAQMAFILMYWCRVILPVNSSPQSPFREIASLLCEILLGERASGRAWDLNRPCRAVLKKWDAVDIPRHRKARRAPNRQSVQT